MELRFKGAARCIPFFCDLHQPLFIFTTTTPRTRTSTISSPSVWGEIKFRSKWKIHLHSAADGRLNLIAQHLVSYLSPPPVFIPKIFFKPLLFSLPAPPPPCGRFSIQAALWVSYFVQSRIAKYHRSVPRSLEIRLSHFELRHLHKPRRGGYRRESTFYSFLADLISWKCLRLSGWASDVAVSVADCELQLLPVTFSHLVHSCLVSYLSLHVVMVRPQCWLLESFNIQIGMGCCRGWARSYGNEINTKSWGRLINWHWLSVLSIRQIKQSIIQ